MKHIQGHERVFEQEDLAIAEAIHADKRPREKILELLQYLITLYSTDADAVLEELAE